MKRWASKGAKAATPRNTAQTAKLFGMYEILHFGERFQAQSGGKQIYLGLILSNYMSSPNGRPPSSWLVGPSGLETPPAPLERRPVLECQSIPAARNAGSSRLISCPQRPDSASHPGPLAGRVSPRDRSHLHATRRLVAPPLSS